MEPLLNEQYLKNEKKIPRVTITIQITANKTGWCWKLCEPSLPCVKNNSQLKFHIRFVIVQMIPLITKQNVDCWTFDVCESIFFLFHWSLHNSDFCVEQSVITIVLLSLLFASSAKQIARERLKIADLTLYQRRNKYTSNTRKSKSRNGKMK